MFVPSVWKIHLLHVSKWKVQTMFTWGEHNGRCWSKSVRTNLSVPHSQDIRIYTRNLVFVKILSVRKKQQQKKNKKCLYPKRAPECFSIYAFAHPLTWTSTARHRIVWFKESLKFNIAYLFEIHSRLWWNFSIFVFALFFFSHETSH